MFLDFDKSQAIFHDNLFLEEYNIVIKVPFFNGEKDLGDIKIENFELAKYIFLISYEKFSNF